MVVETPDGGHGTLMRLWRLAHRCAAGESRRFWLRFCRYRRIRDISHIRGAAGDVRNNV